MKIWEDEREMSQNERKKGVRRSKRSQYSDARAGANKAALQRGRRSEHFRPTPMRFQKPRVKQLSERAAQPLTPQALRWAIRYSSLR
jgi:hypothetical protein